MSASFKLRPWSMDDLPSLVKYAKNFKIAQNMMDGFPHPYNQESGKSFLQLVEKTKDLILCIEIDGEAAGSTGIHLKKDIYRKNAEIGYWIAEPYWGQGIISRVIPEMVDRAFGQFHIERVYAGVFGRNIASQRALQKNGFTLDAKLERTIYKNDQFEDEHIYAVRKDEWLQRRSGH